MNIAYVGNFRHDFTTESYVAWTLEAMGHTVLRIQERAGNRFDPMSVSGFGITLLLWTRTWDGFMTDKDLAVLKSWGITTVSYHLDLYVGLKREATLATDPFWHTDYVFTPDGDPHSAGVFKAKGINHFYLSAGVFKNECGVGMKFKDVQPICFVGNTDHYHDEWPYRKDLNNHLERTYGHDFESYGNNGTYTMRGRKLNSLYSSVKIVIGDSLCTNFTHEGYWSDRVYETTGRGGFIIHPRIKGLEMEFIEGKEIIFYDYGDFKQLDTLINYFLENDEEREAIRRAGMERTYTMHTYTNRMQTLLETING